ncbi:MAG TPA: DUF4365 domain-containing protein [Nostocaceae cyanobacterium]|nr:DUF4365 domain-containing protein [Nostocaceae cyanobacterium]
MSDILGLRGESIFILLITELHQTGAIFRPGFMGDKWPYVDFYVELIGANSTIPHFCVQVKTTRSGYTEKLNRLKISQVSEDKIIGLAHRPSPTYLVGIDEPQRKGYIVSANGENLKSLSSVSTKFPINEENRIILWNEVNKFWHEHQNKNNFVSYFVDNEWR